MRHVFECGYPAPVGVGGRRARPGDGPRHGTDHARSAEPGQPWTFGRHAVTLADLHERLHQVPPPAEMPELAGGGAALLHLDLHPMNVILSPTGPVVIDWPNARRLARPSSTWR